MPGVTRLALQYPYQPGGLTFPKTIFQTCIVHVIRGSMRFVPWKDRKSVGCRSSHCKRRIQRLRGRFWAAWDSRSVALGVELQRTPARVYDIGAGFRAAGSETSCTQIRLCRPAPHLCRIVP